MNPVKQRADKLLKEFQSNFGLEVVDATQGSDDWFNLKLGVISASNASKAVAKKGSATRDTYMCELISQVMSGQMKDISAAPLDWGRSLEDAARASYEFPRNTKIIELPFVFKDNSFRCGASPDGIVSEKRGIEIKCPYASENHVKFLLSDKIKPEYVWQIQYTMWVLGLEEYDFCSYDPRMSNHLLKSLTVEKDPKAHEKMDELIPDFIKEMDHHLENLGIKFGDHWKAKAKKLGKAV